MKICHGKEERCLSFFGRTLPICARCTGVYTGLFIGAVIGVLTNIETSAMALFILTILFSLPTGMDGFTQEFLDRESTNGIRLTTGMLLGGIMGFDIVWMILRST